MSAANTLPLIPSPISPSEAAAMNAVVLAFVGDAVYTLYMRSGLSLSTTAKAGELHRRAIQEVCAVKQAQNMDTLMPLLNEAEAAVFRRARNSKGGRVAKNADLADYKKATGLEAVIGYLYLSGQGERLAELCDAIRIES